MHATVTYFDFVSIEYATINVVDNIDDKKIIYHSRKSLLFDKGNTWMKKRGGIFDVAMGAHDGAEVCELVGTFLLEKLVKFVIKVILDYIGMTVYQFLETKVAHN